MMHNIAIIGSGPAGYAAAVYTARAELVTTIYAGSEPGGQLMKTTEVENYPGFSEGVVGPQLMDEMRKQTTRFGAKIKWETVRGLKREGEGLVVESETGERESYDGVIVAVGASSRMLNVGEEKYYGKGFSTCAVCDAAFYRGKEVYVVGGGDAAIEDSMALTKFAKRVTMIVRRDELSASKIMQKRVLDNSDKVEIRWNTALKEVRGEVVEELVLEKEGKEEIVKAGGLFLAIGHIPATKWLEGSGVELDEKGYIKTGVVGGADWIKGYPTMTTLPGVFAGGDCVDFRYRQAATASGMGVMAALDLEKWLENKN